MGLEVTVLVVLLSRCSYMTVDRAGERGGESDRRRGAVREKKSEGNGTKTGKGRGDR